MSQSNPAYLASVLHTTAANLRSSAFFWNFPSRDLSWKIDTPIEADGSSNAMNIDHDCPKTCLVCLLLAGEIAKKDMVEDSRYCVFKSRIKI